MTRRIGITNRKGGVSKTTDTIDVAGALAASNLTVLAVDMDPQGYLTHRLGFEDTYLADGLPKQGTETLEDVRDYVSDLLEHRRRPVDETELPDDVEPVDQDDGGKGTVDKERVKCGADCTCNDGRGHGPYLYRYYREDGRLTSEYVGNP